MVSSRGPYDWSSYNNVYCKHDTNFLELMSNSEIILIKGGR